MIRLQNPTWAYDEERRVVVLEFLFAPGDDDPDPALYRSQYVLTVDLAPNRSAQTDNEVPTDEAVDAPQQDPLF